MENISGTLKLTVNSMEGSGTYNYYNSGSVWQSSGKIPYFSDSLRIGGGPGVAYTQPLAGPVFLNTRLSALLISYSFSPDFPELTAGGTIDGQDDKCYNYTGIGLGFNAQALLTYYISCAGITISCGYRLQWLKISYIWFLKLQIPVKNALP